MYGVRLSAGPPSFTGVKVALPTRCILVGSGKSPGSSTKFLHRRYRCNRLTERLIATGTAAIDEVQILGAEKNMESRSHGAKADLKSVPLGPTLGEGSIPLLSAKACCDYEASSAQVDDYEVSTVARIMG